jgi:hypothetical protein
VTSTVAHQAFTQWNLLHWQLFWNEPWPIGLHGTPRKRLINIDEFGLHLNAANKKYGSSPWGLKICKPGDYDREMFKLTIIWRWRLGILHCKWSSWIIDYAQSLGKNFGWRGHNHRGICYFHQLYDGHI